MVQSPGLVLRSNLVCRNLEIEIKGVKFPTALIVIESDKLAIILGMNWLTQYHVCINCATREVTTVNQEGCATSFYARRSIPKNDIVFSAVAKKWNQFICSVSIQMYFLRNCQECRQTENWSLQLTWCLEPH